MAWKRSALLVIAVGIHASASAQEARPGVREVTIAANRLSILGTQAAQEDLKLTAEQMAAVRQLLGDHHAAVEARLLPWKGLPDAESAEKTEPILKEIAADTNERLAEILDADQGKRLRQVMLQMDGYMAFFKPEVRDALQLSDEQNAKLVAIRNGFSTEIKEYMTASREDRKAMTAKLRQLKNKATADAIGVLTDDQRARWAELVGPTFPLA